MAESRSPRTPPTHPYFRRHHRMDSFPTDDASELSLSFDEDDVKRAGAGMPESVSLGALPMFLFQEGNRKSIPEFPESPESTYGFAPPAFRTVASPPNPLELSGNASCGVAGLDLERQRHRPSDSWDSLLSVPTRPPFDETQRLSNKPSFLSEEDETLVGHADTSPNKRSLRPVMSFSSGTSTVLASPLSDIFSPGPASTSCSVSTVTSYGSSRRSPCPDEFPTEVGGAVSLELDEPDRILLTRLSEESTSAISLGLDTHHQAEPTLAPTPLSVHTSPISHSIQPHTPKSSILSKATSSGSPNHRRAFSGARELFATSLSNPPSAFGRFRSSSVSSGPNDLIQQAAATRSRSASVSASNSLAPSTHGAPRSLNSAQSKESFRTKFANLPGYVTFLREITLEIWIDQEGFRAIRPRFELHRYTPGQLAPITPNLRLSASPKSPKIARPRTAQLPITSPRKAAEQSRRPSTSSGPVDSERQQFLENWGVAEFTMKKRKGWNFHHGVAEAEPMLRRLTINGVEDRDYLSRQASLSVRTNGVYTVKGTEDHGKFSWKFEYLVEDRRGSTSTIHGEKTLTPLSFSCSPELLIPEQGKKVGLLRVMKKSVIPKISSSKMEVPLPSAPSSPLTNKDPNAYSSPLSNKDKSRKFETLGRIVRPKPSKSPCWSPASLGSRRAADCLEYLNEDGRRRAASHSNMRPDLKEILGEGFAS